MPIAFNSALPLYAQVEAALVSDFATGQLPAGCRLPAEDALCARFGVSRTTVRAAIQALIERGLVEIRRGKGTYVTQPQIRQELTELSGFVEDMQAVGRHPTARLVSKQIEPAGQEVAEKLALITGAPVYRIERVRLADGIPISFDETYLPLEIGEQVVANDLEAEPIFSLLEQKYDLPLMEAEYQLEARAAEPRIAQHLRVAPQSPIFFIERTTYCAGPRPIDYERLYYRGDLVRFVTRLARRSRGGTPSEGA